MAKASKKNTASKAKTKKPAKPVASPNLLSEIEQPLGPKALAKLYAFGAVAVLALTSFLWALFGAKLQQANADQLVNPYLFDNANTLHGATVPGAHSFLIKWPLFYLIKLFGYSSTSYIAITIFAVLATIAALVLILYRIERRPLVFGTICLALASVLLLVPAQPYADALLPVNMAMLATRNLEYAVYLVALLLLIKSAGRWSGWFWLSVVTLGVLAASDKLFVGLSLGGALLALVVYSLKRRWDRVNLSSSWLAVVFLGAVLGVSILFIINASGFTHISSDSGGSPYAAVKNGNSLVLGTLYGALGILTNFGANPAYDSTIVRQIPQHVSSGLLSFGGPGYIVNFIILLFAVYSALYLVINSLKKTSPWANLDRYTSLAIMLMFSALASLILFIATSHYYAVDSRYLTIWLFGLFVCTALFTRGRNWPRKYLMLAGVVLAISIVFGIANTTRVYGAQSKSLANMRERDLSVAQALKSHPVSVLVGDYWRVLPAKAASGNKLNVMPLASCTEARQLLSSNAWQPNIKHQSFAYLLSLDRSLTDFPQCNLPQVLSNYGRPNSTILIAGSFSHPKELLLIYDRGIHIAPAKTGSTTAAATVLPLNLADLMNTTCSRPTVLNIVAHEDDDLLFMNPDLRGDIKSGHCVRTIYLTAGDAGNDRYYWLAREAGSEAAYSKMLGENVVWIERTVKISPKAFISIANPRGNPSISLIFVHLADGGLHGNGFAQTGFQSLEKLSSGQIQTIDSVDKQSQYTYADLKALLASIMHIYQPTEIRTQSSFPGTTYTDHSDHMAVGRLATVSYQDYEMQQFEGEISIPINYYVGYPIREMPENVGGTELQEKEAVFLEYAKHDESVCQSVDQCSQTPTYSAYLPRQYRWDN